MRLNFIEETTASNLCGFAEDILTEITANGFDDTRLNDMVQASRVMQLILNMEFMKDHVTLSSTHDATLVNNIALTAQSKGIISAKELVNINKQWSTMMNE